MPWSNIKHMNDADLCEEFLELREDVSLSLNTGMGENNVFPVFIEGEDIDSVKRRILILEQEIRKRFYFSALRS